MVFLSFLAAALAAAWAFPRLRRVASVGCSYKAKALASALFVSGLDTDPERAPEIADEAYRLMRLFRARVDRDKKTVTVSFFGLQPRTATYRPGLGATLTAGPLPPPPARKAPAPAPALPLRESPALSPILDAAFAETGPRRRRTRAVVVVQDGAVVGERYAHGITPDTPLNGWSMTKSVMGALIGTLVGDGTLKLEDKSLLKEWRAPGDPRAGISLEDLLRMRSGLRFSEVYADPLSDVTRMLFDGHDAGGFAASRPLEAPPGTFWKYSSGTTNILSLVARRALGEEAYPVWPRRALFDPLGMASAVLEPDASGTFVGSSFLFATARDWARFGLLHANDGAPLLPEDWVRFGTTPTPQAPGGKYGAHWWLKLSPELGGGTAAADRIPADAFHALGHEGQCLTVIPSRRLVVVRLGLSIDIKAWDHAAFLAETLDALPA
ncbi:MAG: beta-lactamase family protein [Elusimicrobia bacterium]|nr:beta-lactamase family protein [Elusimicrobiota bacterium]